MKYFFLSLLVAALAGGYHNAAAAVSIRYAEGKPTALSGDRQDKIAKLTIELLRTASYETTATIAQEQFNKAQRQTLLHVNFTPARRIFFRFGTKGPVTEKTSDISELMVPFSTDRWPDFLFVREGRKLRAFSKYDPRAAQAWRDTLKEICIAARLFH